MRDLKLPTADDFDRAERKLRESGPHTCGTCVHFHVIAPSQVGTCDQDPGPDLKAFFSEAWQTTLRYPADGKKCGQYEARP